MRTQTSRAEQVRDGLFLAASRTYGEQYVEPFIRAIYKLRDAVGADYDAISENGLKYEIKACKVLRSSLNRRGTRNLLERILYENDNVSVNRAVPFAEALTADYDANVQNVKRDHFDELIYVLLFADCVKIFQSSAQDILIGQFRGWSDKHGRYDQHGKSGQFMVNKRSVQWHLDNYLRDTLTYYDVAQVFSRLSDG